MSREVYYVHPKAHSSHVRGKVTRSILACFLVVKGCLMVFGGLCRGLDFGVFGKLSLFYGALRVKICASAGVDQAVLILKQVNGAVFHE